MPSSDFFENSRNNFSELPLAVRMRPASLEEYAGQEHILAPGALLRRAIEADRISSLILFGPPGTGKTSLAWCIALKTKSHYVALNATTSNVEELRKTIALAKQRRSQGQGRTILFIDEIHRFNKAQQDVLLPDVEEGNPVLIGATVQNPYFALASALLSRSLVCELKSLSEENIASLIRRALEDKERGLGSYSAVTDKDAVSFLARASEGDARRALSALEIACLTTAAGADGKVRLSRDIFAESIQKKPVVYDHDGDGHYDTASAFIKSMRGSDPDAAVYWMAKMLKAGEDPRFIARRLCILAAEDVGNADPMALVLANAALSAAEFVGMPEARIPLAQAVIYVACAPKSNASYMAIEKAQEALEEERVQEVPDHLKKAAKGYKYAHDYEGNFVVQDYLRQGRRFYEPTKNGFEAKIKQRLDILRASRQSSEGSSE